MAQLVDRGVADDTLPVHPVQKQVASNLSRYAVGGSLVEAVFVIDFGGMILVLGCEACISRVVHRKHGGFDTINEARARGGLVAEHQLN